MKSTETRKNEKKKEFFCLSHKKFQLITVFRFSLLFSIVAHSLFRKRKKKHLHSTHHDNNNENALTSLFQSFAFALRLLFYVWEKLREFFSFFVDAKRKLVDEIKSNSIAPHTICDNNFLHWNETVFFTDIYHYTFLCFFLFYFSSFFIDYERWILLLFNRAHTGNKMKPINATHFFFLLNRKYMTSKLNVFFWRGLLSFVALRRNACKNCANGEIQNIKRDFVSWNDFEKTRLFGIFVN